MTILAISSGAIIAIVAAAAIVLVMLLLTFGRNLFRSVSVRLPGGAAIRTEGKPAGKVSIVNTKAGRDMMAHNRVGGNTEIRDSDAQGRVDAISEEGSGHPPK